MKGLTINWKALLLFISKLFTSWKNKKGGGKMKLAVLVVVLMLVGSLVMAQDITLKQGALMTWEKLQFKNVTSVQVIETTPIEEWGKWNALWDGWVVDASWIYDGADLTGCGLMLGRKLGTLQSYLPFNFPLADKIDVTLYPVGMYVESMFDHPQFQGASGGAFVNLQLKF